MSEKTSGSRRVSAAKEPPLSQAQRHIDGVDQLGLLGAPLRMGANLIDPHWLCLRIVASPQAYKEPRLLSPLATELRAVMTRSPRGHPLGAAHLRSRRLVRIALKVSASKEA